MPLPPWSWRVVLPGSPRSTTTRSTPTPSAIPSARIRRMKTPVLWRLVVDARDPDAPREFYAHLLGTNTTPELAHQHSDAAAAMAGPCAPGANARRPHVRRSGTRRRPRRRTRCRDPPPARRVPRLRRPRWSSVLPRSPGRVTRPTGCRRRSKALRPARRNVRGAGRIGSRRSDPARRSAPRLMA